MSRIHAIVGHSMRGTKGFWGELQGRESVDVSRGGDRTVAVDLDIAGTKLGVTAEIDVNFDLRFGCRLVDGEAVFRLRADNFDVNSDFDGIAKLFLFAFEGRIDNEIEEALPSVNRRIQIAGLAFCPQIIVNEDGSVGFGLPEGAGERRRVHRAGAAGGAAPRQPSRVSSRLFGSWNPAPLPAAGVPRSRGGRLPASTRRPYAARPPKPD